VPIKHAFESEVTDGADPDLVGPDEWNDNHTIDGAEDVPYDDPEGMGVDNVKEALDFLASSLMPVIFPGLSATLVDTVTAVGGDPITWTVPGTVQDGDLIVLATGHHNVVPTNNAMSGQGFTQRLRFDTDGNEWVTVHTKIASGESGSWTLDTNSASTTLSCGSGIILRGPSTFVRDALYDGSLDSPPILGEPDGHLIAIWLSALAGGTAFDTTDSFIDKHLVYRPVSGEPGQMFASRPSRVGFPLFEYSHTASAPGISGTWLACYAMIWT
jgi:hypothetical protein